MFLNLGLLDKENSVTRATAQNRVLSEMVIPASL